MNHEVIVCASLGSLLLVVGEWMYARGPRAVGLAAIGVGLVLLGPAIGVAHFRASASRTGKAAAGATTIASVLTALALGYLAYVVWTGGAASMEPAMLPFLGVVVGVAVAGVSLARAKQLSYATAAVLPIAFLAWPPLEEAFPSWGGVIGAALAAGGTAVQLSALRRASASVEPRAEAAA